MTRECEHLEFAVHADSLEELRAHPVSLEDGGDMVPDSPFTSSMSDKEIADKLGIPVRMVREARNELGIQADGMPREQFISREEW